ncbi:MAG: sigma-54 interaction domain-containing protein, partial [bacterium]
ENGKKKQLQEKLVLLEKLAAIVAPHLRSVQKIRKYFEPLPPDEALLCQYEKVGLLGKSQKFVELLQAIETAARSDVRVLLEGQSGTGKELIARAIHKFSPRCQYPFVAIDCGAIPPHLLESELFGSVKGAFTGANSDRQGLLVEADGGTLFMDEIANLPIEMQTKLMRVLQENEIRPLGSNKPIKIDVRIISASSSSLKALVAKEKFRKDLYFRLHVYPIQVPGLNERQDDIALLAEHFLLGFATQQAKQSQRFHEEIIDLMKVRHWEGHIRELENFVERLVTLASPKATVITKQIFPPDIRKEMKSVSKVIEEAYLMKSLPESLDEYEERLIRQALNEYDWNKSRAARALKIPVQTILYKMERLGIKKGD